MWEPIGRRTLSEGVYEQLRDRILDGELAVGERVPPERELCESLGVNRGALREALRRLEQSGLISVRHGGSSRVQDFRAKGSLPLLRDLRARERSRAPSPDDPSPTLWSCLELRAAIGPAAARLAALHIHPERMAPLEDGAAELDASEATGAPALDGQLGFWSELVVASESIAFRLADHSVVATLREDSELAAALLEPERETADGHQRLIEAIIGGEAERAEQAARSLLQRGAASWRRQSDGPH